MKKKEGDKVIFIDPARPDPSLIKMASDAVRDGGIIIFPTETLYGIGADALNESSLRRIFDIKKRELTKPVLVLIDDPSFFGDLALEIPPLAKALMNRFWPGGLTLLLRARPCLSPLLTGGTGTVGVRMSSHPVAEMIVRESGRPITATSANLSGDRGPSSIDEISSELIDLVDLVIDSGRTSSGQPSTIVDVTSPGLHIVREGIIAREEIEAFIYSISQMMEEGQRTEGGNE